MKAEDDEMLPEYDFSNGIRGVFATRWTPEQREAILRDGAIGTVRELTCYGQKQVRELEAALFTLLVIAGNEPVQKAVSHAAALLDPERVPALNALVAEARDAGLLDEGLAGRVRCLAKEREWLVQPRTEAYTGPGSLNAVAERLDAIWAEAKALRERIESLIEQHLARSGLSEQEIERRTEETAKLWLAA